MFKIPEIPNYIKEKYELIDANPIGAGGFGAVFRIRDKRVFNEYVLKMISKQKTEKKYFDKEKNFLLKVKGTNIVKLIDYYEDDKSDYYYFVFEKMEGDLQQLLDTKYKNGMPLEMIKKIFSQLNSALKLMKNFKLSHRDLKPANILYSYIGENDFIIKLADFGISTDLKTTTQTASKIGTPIYMAPEIEKGKYNDKCDLYSLGIILYQLKTGKNIFGNTL
jgi:serine/threonine protein kinase